MISIMIITLMIMMVMMIFQLLETYLAFCGMAISNAQAIESYSKEYDRNKVG